MIHYTDFMPYRCWACGKEYPYEEHRYRCSCGGFFLVKSGSLPSPKALARRDLTLWRYREFFGLPQGLEPVSLGEGRTPLIAKRLQGEEVRLKLDFLQPSGSFKDRGATVLVSLARHIGVRELVEDSSGNAGAAVSAYAAAAGISCTVFVPEYTPEGKLVQMRLYGAKVVKVPGKRQDANNAAIQAAQKAFYASHLWNPFFVQGLATSAFEIWEQLGGEVPARVVVPVGSGGYLEGLFLGFTALVEAGLAGRLPALVGVQAEKCPPLHRAFQQGLEEAAEVETEVTVAEGIAVQRPPRARAVLQALRQSGGRTVGVSEEEILSAARSLFSAGIFVEPTSAAALAGWLKLDKNESKNAVVILTGSGLKETRKLGELYQE